MSRLRSDIPVTRLHALADVAVEAESRATGSSVDNHWGRLEVTVHNETTGDVSETRA